MRISDIMRLGKSAIIFATIVVAFLAIIWLLGYKMIYKKILHGKKQISIGRIGARDIIGSTKKNHDN